MRTTRFNPILVLVLFCACAVFAYAAPDQELSSGMFSRANSEYQNGNYASAAQIYKRVLESGFESGPLYYNLGNACFKQKQLGEAIYYWEKALQKSPMDRETRENLDLANLLIVDRIEIPADPLPARILSGAFELLTITQELWLTLTLFFLANALFAFYLLSNNRFSSRALIGSFAIGILFLLFAGSLSWKTYDRNFRKQGIVVEQKVDVRSGPGLGNIIVFPIHEGLKVRVYESSNGWRQISLPNGWTGWLRESDIRIL
jgi:tetratricopeptide (TPR) repeat protein